jgi:hypothetical protein
VDYYGLGRLPSVDRFVRSGPAGAREQVLVREQGDWIEVAVELPAAVLALPTTAPRLRLAALVDGGHVSLDELCQVLEGVSHFVLLADRAGQERPTTQLELELQAEVDKYVLLAVTPRRPMASHERIAVRRRLFRPAGFVDPPGTARGERYRIAHQLAWRLTRRIERRYLREARHAELRVLLRRFYRVGQADKIALARAA